MKILLIVILVSFTLNLNGQDSTGYISPKPTGPWNVGRQVVEWIDSSRIDIIDSTQYRTIPVFVWYSAIVNDTIIPNYPLDEDLRNEQRKYLDKKIGADAALFLQNLKTW